MTEKILFNQSYTQEEIDQMKMELAEIMVNKRQLDREKLEALNKFNDQIEVLIRKCDELSDIISQGYEVCHEECELRKNYETMKMEYWSIRFERIVRTRPMTLEERQLEIE
jgi:hypothetical protein